jgi:hypothetical protein
MGSSAAIEIALTLAEQPDAIQWVSREPLPPGVSLLLEVAIGEADALNTAQMMTARSHDVLQSAAAVFIEQVLLTQTADSYRVLGTACDASRRQLRRHMALLVKWLHPDGFDQGSICRGIDRSIFCHRVTRAWEDLKNDGRRAAYDRMSSPDPGALLPWHATSNLGLGPTEGAKSLIAYRSHKSGRRRVSRRLVIYRIPNDTLFSRLLYYFGRHA